MFVTISPGRLGRLALAAAIGLPATPAGAQVNTPASTPIRFAWPSTVDARTYGVVETCVAMYDNHRRRMLRQAKSDTIADVREVYFSRPLPREVVDALRRCAEPFTVDQLLSGDRAHINAVANAFRMLLLAGRRPDAHAVAAWWIGALGPAEGDLRHEGIARFFSGALDLSPTRWDDAWAIVDVYDPRTEWERRFGLGAYVMQVAHYKMGDTTQLLKAARWVIRTTEVLDDSITTSEKWRRGGARSVYQAQKHLIEGLLMDSLARSTSTYIRYLNTLQQTLGISGQEHFPQADSVRGEYWFPSRPPTGRPARGAPSVVIMTPDNECGGCGAWLPLVKRAHERFPAVEFTLVAQTRGHYGTVLEPVTPDVEARLIDSVYRTANQLPATVVVHRTQFVRVEDPDRRRVNFPGPNAKSYDMKCGLFSGTKAYVIDREGIVVDQFCLSDAYAARRLDRLLGALVLQQ